jgi:WD40 repeat protein
MIRCANKMIIWMLAAIIGVGMSAAVPLQTHAEGQDPASGVYENLGTALKRVVGIGGTPFDGPDGTPYISVAVNGSPAQFVVLHALTLEVVKIIDIPGTTTTSALVTGSDGKVYIGSTGSGELFRYSPGADALEPLGKPVAGETHIFDVTNGPDGKIYGGTYPGGKLFEYDPGTGAFRSFGTLVPGEKYVRQVAYDSERSLFYVGTGTSNKLVEFDPETGSVSANFMPEFLAIEEYPNSIDLIGGKLFIQLNKTGTMIVMDKTTKTIEHERKVTSAHVIPSPQGDKAYMFSPGDAFLHAYDFATGQISPVVRLGGFNSWKSARFVNTGTPQSPVYTLSAWAGYNAALTYEMSTGTLRSKTVDVPGQPIEIRSIAGGPDGRVYVSGSQGGTGIYDPSTGTMESRTSGISQAEGIAALGDVLYFGVYPQARVSMFDTRLPWAAGNPVEVAKFQADSLQDRPFGMIAAEDINKLFIGTVPQYGELGGAFGIYDPATKTLQSIRNLVQDQSIITLAYKDGKVYGGTSIWGAYGAPAPTASEGKLFVWDAASGQKELEITPVAGKQAVTSLIVGPDGNIWGFDEGVLFIFDSVSQTVTEQHPLMDIRYAGTLWADAYMLTGKDGNVYGTARGVFFRVDGKTKQVTVLDDTRQFGNLTQDNNGALYMRSGIEGKKHELWRYTNPDLAMGDLLESMEQHGLNSGAAEGKMAILQNALSQAVHHEKNNNLEQTVHFMNKSLDILDDDAEDLSEEIRSELHSKILTLVGLLQV